MLRVLLINSTSNVILLIIRLGVAFIMTPIIVKTLGNYDYGILEIVGGILGYMGILEIGIQPAIGRYVARYNALANDKKLNNIYSSSLLFMIAVGFFCLVIFCSLALVAPEIMEGNGADDVRYILFFIVIGVQTLITFPGLVFECFHQGFQRYYLTNMVTVAVSLLGNFILFLLLQRGGALLTVVLMGAAMSFVRYTLYWLLLQHRKYGGFSLRIKDFSWDALKELFTFGFKILLLGIAGRISYGTDSFVIGGFLGAAMVAFYAIPANLIRRAFNLIRAITLSFMPFFSELDARNESNVAEQMFLFASRFVVCIVLLISIELFFLGIPFITRWMSPKYASEGYWVFFYLLIASLFPMLNPFQGRFLTAIGRHGLLAKVAWPIAILNLALSLTFVNIFGKEGVALGTMIPELIFYPVVLHLTCKYVGISIYKYFQKVLLPQVFPSLGLCLMSMILSSKFLVDTYFDMFCFGLFTSFCYIMIFFFTSVSSGERTFLLNNIKARVSQGKVA